jgi:hypothetical protein
MCRLPRELAGDERVEQILDRFDITARELAVDVHLGQVGDGLLLIGFRQVSEGFLPYGQGNGARVFTTAKLRPKGLARIIDSRAAPHTGATGPKLAARQWIGGT